MGFRHILQTSTARLAGLFLASRIALLTVGLLSASLLPRGSTVQRGNLIAHSPAPLPLEIWARWDAEWYLLIAAEGYDLEHHFAKFAVPYERYAASGYLPLYPVLIRSLTPLLRPVVAGVLISNLCLFLSLIILERLVRLEIAGAAGETASLAACAALLLHPSSLFLSSVYPESLFLALSLGVFYSARRKNFAVAGVLGGLAAVTRPFGVLLVVPLLWEWWDQRRTDRPEAIGGRGSRGSVLWAALPAAAFAGYMVFCRFAFGDSQAFFHRQARWRGGLSGPWRAFVRWWEAGPQAHGAHGSTLELAVAIACLAMLVVMVRRLRFSYTLYTGCGMAIALGSTLWSFSRLTLTLFPFFILIGETWVRGRRWWPVLYAFVGATLGGFLMALFASWWWAG